MIKKVFSPDASYRQTVNAYDRTDALIAAAVYISLIILYLCAGYLSTAAGFTLAPVIANVLLIVIVLAAVRLRKQKFDTVGLTLRHFKRALAAGLVTGFIIALFVNIPPNLLSGGKLVWAGFGFLLHLFGISFLIYCTRSTTR
jgi:hypothetical protein